MTPQRRRLAVVAVLAAVTDLATKLAASAVLDDRVLAPPGPLTLRLAHNPGVAFGLGDTVPTWALVGLTVAVTVGVGIGAWRGSLGPPTAVGLVLGGAIANVLDRIQAGTVVDMLDLGWWPTFNLADTFITIGAGLLFLDSLTGDPRPVPEPEHRAAA